MPAIDKDRVYESAKDTWLMILMYSGPVFVTAAGFYAIWDQQPDAAMVCFLMAVATVALTMSLTYPCRYTLTKDMLNIRCGFVSRSIQLEKIDHAELSGSWLSGPALSLRRVKIKYGWRSCLISPVDREQFLADLNAAVARCKQESASPA